MKYPDHPIASPYKFSRSQPEYRHTGVQTGSHSEEVLRELGYTEDQIITWRTANVFA